MNLLALESATERCSVALWQDGVLIRRQWQEARPHSETLLPLVQALLDEAGLGVGQLDAIAFGMGPGAFTGLRMACGTAQGLALGAGIPVVPVSTLLALAQGTRHDRVVAALDARMNQIYLAVYERRQQTWLTRVEPCLCDPGKLPPLPEGPWLPAGSGVAAHEGRLREAWPGQLLPFEATHFPDAAQVAELGVALFLQGRGVAPELAAPAYLRDKVALTTAERNA